MKYYIAYGSNLSVSQMCHRCPDAVYVGTCELPGFRLSFRGSGAGCYLSVDRAEGHSVRCLVWRISDLDEEMLDVYEGYPKHYTKFDVEVDLVALTGQPLGRITAMIYALPETCRTGVPIHYYYEICRDGYRLFDFPTDDLLQALQYSVGKVKTQKFLRYVKK